MTPISRSLQMMYTCIPTPTPTPTPTHTPMYAQNNHNLNFGTSAPSDKSWITKKFIPAVKKIVPIVQKVGVVAGKVATIASIL